MANEFKNAYLDASTSNSDIIGAIASSTTAVVMTLRATNIDGSNDATVDVEVVDGGGSAASYLAKGMNVPAGSSIELAGDSKIVLETTDKIQGLASASGDIEFFASYVLIT